LDILESSVGRRYGGQESALSEGTPRRLPDGQERERSSSSASVEPAVSTKAGQLQLQIKADRLHSLVPRETKRWHDLHRNRAAVEPEFGRLKHALERAALYADLTMLARLS